MRLLKFCKYFYYIKTYFSRLPLDIQNEILDNMKIYYDLARISRSVDLNKEVVNECSRKS